MRCLYPCVLTPEEAGGFFVVFPDVPGALTNGLTRAEALTLAEDALGTALAGYVHERWIFRPQVPSPRVKCALPFLPLSPPSWHSIRQCVNGECYKLRMKYRKCLYFQRYSQLFTKISQNRNEHVNWRPISAPWAAAWWSETGPRLSAPASRRS